MTTTDGLLSFEDNVVPAAARGIYEITVEQRLAKKNGGVLGSFALQAPQTVEVTGARFVLGPEEVHGAYPPPGSAGSFHTLLPHVALERRVLPWESRLALDRDADTTPWLALVLFAGGELVNDPGAQGATDSATVGALVRDGSGPVRVPGIDPKTLTEAERAVPIRTVTVRKDVFGAVMPTPAELPYLAHVRSPFDSEQVRTATGSEQRAAEYAFVLANRLPRPEGGPHVAHLVSLEGLERLLAEPPDRDVRLISLYSWAFTSAPDAQERFADIVDGLARPADRHRDIPDALALTLPAAEDRHAAPEGAEYEKHARMRLREGRVPLCARSHAGEPGFAWYRGPLTPSPVAEDEGAARWRPRTGGERDRAERYRLHDEDYGTPEVGYEAAWTLGRGLALADEKFATAMAGILGAFRTVLGRSATGPDAGTPPSSAGSTGTRLYRHNTHRGDFHTLLLADGVAPDLGGLLTDASPAPGTADGGGVRALASAAALPDTRDAITDLLSDEGVHAVLAQAAAEDPVDLGFMAQWLVRLRRLHPVPFDYLVPRSEMLPREGLRFFHVDRAWLDALTAGALSIGACSGLELRVIDALGALLASGRRQPADADPVCGLLIRSVLASDWPEVRIQAWASGDETRPIAPLRPDPRLEPRPTLAPDVLIRLYASVPATVTVTEPFHGLHLGIDTDHERGDHVNLRSLAEERAGRALDDVFVPVPYRASSGPGATVVNIAGPPVQGAKPLVEQIADAMRNSPGPSTAPITAAGLALQMIQTPEKAVLGRPRP